MINILWIYEHIQPISVANSLEEIKSKETPLKQGEKIKIEDESVVEESGQKRARVESLAQEVGTCVNSKTNIMGTRSYVVTWLLGATSYVGAWIVGTRTYAGHGVYP